MNNKFLFGSKMLRLNNCRDEDWIIFSNDMVEQYDHKSPCHHINIQHEKKIIDNFKTNNIISNSVYQALFLYQMSEGFHCNESNFPIKFNILQHKAPVLLKSVQSAAFYKSFQSLAVKFS